MGDRTGIMGAGALGSYAGAFLSRLTSFLTSFTLLVRREQ